MSAPVQAQVDLSGEWSARYHEDQEHRIPGPELGDYTGLPINDAARLKADSWDASILSLREHQAKPHPSTYSLRGPANIRITKAVRSGHAGDDRLRAVRHVRPGDADDLAGRPSAPAGLRAAHLGRLLDRPLGWRHADRRRRTHFKVGWIQRNGVAHSDAATMTEHFIRHGDVLTVVTHRGRSRCTSRSRSSAARTGC